MSCFWAIRSSTTASLTEKLKLLGGQYFDQNQQSLDLQKLRDEYGGDGYVFAKIEADNRLLEEPGMLDIVYNVDEGARYRVGRINIEIKGENPHTQIMTVLNRLSFKPGDIVDTREFAASERRLKSCAALQGRAAEGHRAQDRLLAAQFGRQGHGDRRPAANELLRVPGGEAPLPPGEAYLDFNVSVGMPWPPEAAPPPQNTTYAPARLSAAHLPRTDLPATGRYDSGFPGQAYRPAAAGPADLRALSNAL